jgi:hypothetical protein
MAAKTNTPSTEDIWHLNIEDLFAPLPEKTRLGGPGPFVINLSASSAPIDVPAKGLARCPHAHVYQVQRMEDRRPRYRLRLGPFTSEDDADAELLKVRDVYPGALTATADADDLRIIAALQVKAPAPPPAAAKPTVPTLVEAIAKQSEAPAAPAPFKAAATQTEAPVVPTLVEAVMRPVAAPAAATPVKAAATQGEAPMVLTLAEEVTRPAAAPVVPTPGKAIATQAEAPIELTLVEEITQPVETPALRPAVAAAAKPVELPATRPSLVPTAKPVDKPAAQSAAKPAAKAAAPAPATPKSAAAKPAIPALMTAMAPLRAPVASQAEQASQRAINLESTQTVRALTQLEMEDDQASRWFAIQLSLAEEAFDPETLPNLDIFRVYRLYSVAGIDQGRIVHALRLGFFTEQIAAGAVASYLAPFYDKPTIKRVSSAERERFAEQSLEARKDVGATGRQAVIEITNERYIREKRVGQGAVK